jgi:hypothetical protein
MINLHFAAFNMDLITGIDSVYNFSFVHFHILYADWIFFVSENFQL